MKNTKSILIFLLAGTVTFTVGVWLYSTKATLGTTEIVVAGLVAILVLFSITTGIKKFKDEKKGLTPEDELSNSIKQKAAAMAFMCSFYLWLFILLFMEGDGNSLDIPIGAGILGMGILFIGFWIYYSKKGLTNV